MPGDVESTADNGQFNCSTLTLCRPSVVRTWLTLNWGEWESAATSAIHRAVDGWIRTRVEPGGRRHGDGRSQPDHAAFALRNFAWHGGRRPLRKDKSALPLFATAAYVLTQNLGIASKRILLLLGHADLFQNVGPIVYAMPSSQPIAAVLLGLNAFPLSPFFLPFSFAILILSMYRDEGFWAVPLESKLALERGR